MPQILFSLCGNSKQEDHDIETVQRYLRPDEIRAYGFGMYRDCAIFGGSSSPVSRILTKP